MYERVRFDHDDRTACPLLIVKITTSKKGNITTLFDIEFYISVFDFYDEVILCKEKINRPEFFTSYLKNDWESFINNLTLTQSQKIIEKDDFWYH